MMELEHIYAKKLALIMEEYIKGNIDSEEYLIELERIEDWYKENLNATNSRN
jgi:hypothetical protein